MLDSIVSLIGSVGFPIAMCVYVYITESKKQTELCAAINMLTEEIRDLKNLIQGGETH